ncbi:PilZ domain-containing protein [Sphingomonas sp.]|jgi:hypothetical protein|uniref:PilZ domain-containing protein n=1 Tax=Sphingomonas sp. TaxID=28214 RepID=UPI002ED795E5
MAVNARLYRDLRGSPRYSVVMDSTLRDESLRPFDVVVEDLSATGVRVPAVADLDTGALITLGIRGIGMCNARVARVDDHGYGCEFLFPLSDDELAEALATVPAPPLPLPLATPLLPQTVATRAQYSLGDNKRVGVGLALAAAAVTASYWALHLPS